MGTHTQIKETRTVLRNTDGTQIYRNVLYCVDEGPLNDKGVFVFQIFNTRNALADIFQRVAEVVDLETYPNDRNTAVAAGDEFWRADAHTLEFDDVEVANVAVRTISDRVNTLVNDFVAYQTEFETTPDETLNFPTAEPTVIDERKEEYEEAVTEYSSAVTAEADALVDKESADTALATANGILTEWQAEKDQICGNLGSGGSEQGLTPEMDATGNAFLELYNGSSSPFTWTTNADEFKTDVQDFYDAATEIISGGSAGAFLKCTVTCASLAGAGDVGKAVNDGGTTGYLVAIAPIDSSSQTWWISDATGMTTGAVTLGGASGYNIDSIVETTGASPYESLLTILSAQLTDMQTTLDEADTYKVPTDEAIIDHTEACTAADVTVSAKTATVNEEELAVKEKEAAYITTQGATQAAYDNVITKYEAVKEVCPTWSPDPPLPAQP